MGRRNLKISSPFRLQKYNFYLMVWPKFCMQILSAEQKKSQGDDYELFFEIYQIRSIIP